LNKFFLIIQRALPGNEFEIFMKAGEVVEAAFKTKLFNAHFVFD
jgi:hypothetical protein